MSTSELHQPDPNPYAPPASGAGMPLAWTSEPVIESLRQTRPWVIFFSILGFLFTAIAVCTTLAAAVLSLDQPTPYATGQALGKATGKGLFGILYFFASLYLWRFARCIRDLTYTRRVADLEGALRAQKSFWRFCGIVMALVLTLYVVIIGFGAFGALGK